MENRVIGDEAGDRTAAPGQGVRILVVDDDAGIRRYLGTLLGERWRVRTVGNGTEALGVLRDWPADLILSDVMMPRMDGIELLRRLRADPATQSIPVILLSGRAGEEGTISGLEAGADDYVVKPFSPRELLVRVQSRLEITAMRKRNVEQQAALAALEGHRQWTERLLDSLPVPLLLVEPGTGRVTFSNRSARRLAAGAFEPGCSLDALEHHGRLTDERDVPLAHEDITLVRAAKGERVEGGRMVWHTPIGRLSLVVDSEILPGGEGHPATAVVALRDVSELVRTENELRSAVLAREEFLSMASHELRTPLTTLGLQAEGLVRTLSKIPAAREIYEGLAKKAESVRSQATRLEQLVDKLLDVSRMVSGRLELSLEALDLGAIVRDVAASLEEQAQRAGSPLVVTIDDAVTGWWDRMRIEQLVTNLVSNAIKFGRGKPIEITVERGPSHGRIVVRDHGIGMTPEETSRIFQRFERACSDQHYPGLGLGLWIGRQIVEAMGGRISVESERGEGSRFIIELPRAT